MASLYRQQLEKWLSNIEVDVKSVLDVGGGQLPIQKRVRSFKADEVRVLDHDSQYNPDIFHDLNYHYDPEPTKDGIPYGDYFDTLFCLEVFEYIFDPVTAHQTLCDFLKPKGVAYISYPTIYPLHNPPGIDYLRYSKFVIEKYLTISGFASWEITPRIATNGAGSLANFYSQEQMRPMKNTSQVFDIGYLVKAYKGV